MIHKTKDGKMILISQMEDSHLKNTIDLFIKQIKECQSIMDDEVKHKSNLDYITSGLDMRNSKDRAESTLKKILHTIPYYVYEATIRGINYTEQLQDMYSRTGSLELPKL